MPRDISRAVRHPNREIVESAVKATRESLSASGAIPSTPLPIAEPANMEVLDLDGNPVERHDFMLGIDTLGDPAARLKVNGRQRHQYYRN